jgi:hypothetical protein
MQNGNGIWKITTTALITGAVMVTVGWQLGVSRNDAIFAQNSVIFMQLKETDSGLLKIVESLQLQSDALRESIAITNSNVAVLQTIAARNSALIDKIRDQLGR